MGKCSLECGSGAACESEAGVGLVSACRASDFLAGPVACGSDLARSLIVHGEPPVFPAEEKVRIVLSILAGEVTVAEAARRPKLSE
jgi:hypothetical protein